MEILTPFTGEFLVLLMLLFLNGRIFFTRHTRIDALSVLAPFSLITIILEMLAWGVRPSNIAILALSIICTLTNYRSLVRFSQKLFVDSYSVKFFITSILLLILTIFIIIVDIIVKPIRLQTRRYNIEVNREYFSCPLANDSFRLKKASEVTDKKNMTLYTFSNVNHTMEKDTVILFVPDVLAETLQYETYFILLARKGYTVLTADLYDTNFHALADFAGGKCMRRFLLLCNEYSSSNSGERASKKFLGRRAHDFHDIYESSYKALAALAKERYPNKNIFVVSDASAFLPKAKMNAVFKDVFGDYDTRSAPGLLNLSAIKEYSTPGFGFITQSDPLFAKMLFDKKKDRTLFEPSYCAMRTAIIIGAK